MMKIPGIVSGIFLKGADTMNFEELTEFLDSCPERFATYGGDLMVMHHHRPVYRHTFGMADRKSGRKMQGNEVYRIYSCSKVATCTAIMKLMEEGKLSLDQPLAEILPEFSRMQVQQTDEHGEKTLRPAKNPILIRHLLTMTAGMTYDCGSDPIRRVKEATQGRVPTMDGVRAMAQMPLVFDPGDHWHYSLCHDVLGGVVETLSGQKFSEYMTEHFFEPLGMRETFYYLLPQFADRYMPQYTRNSEGTLATPMDPDNNAWFELGSEYESGGAGVVSTVEDYIRFAEMLTSGGVTPSGRRLISRESIDTMRKTYLPMEKLSEFGSRALGYSYALGVRTHVNGPDEKSQSGKYEFGWDGAAGAYIEADPENEISIYFGCSTRAPANGQIHPVIRNLVHRELNGK